MICVFSKISPGPVFWNDVVANQEYEDAQWTFLFWLYQYEWTRVDEMFFEPMHDACTEVLYVNRFQVVTYESLKIVMSS